MPVDKILIEEGKEERLRLRFLLPPNEYSGGEGDQGGHVDDEAR
jgi:hypothetical protein